jgi:hypothetical protein
MGFVESRRSLPPKGATRSAPDVFRKCRHLPRVRRHVGPIANATQVAAVGEANHRDPLLRRLADTGACGELADHLAEAAMAVDDRDRVALEHDARRRFGERASRIHSGTCDATSTSRRMTTSREAAMH